MKTNEERNALKEEVKTLNEKLAELNEEELAQVTGGAMNLDYIFMNEYCPGIMFYYLTTGEYYVENSKGDYRIVPNAGQIEDAAKELLGE